MPYSTLDVMTMTVIGRSHDKRWLIVYPSSMFPDLEYALRRQSHAA